MKVGFLVFQTLLVPNLFFDALAFFYCLSRLLKQTIFDKL